MRFQMKVTAFHMVDNLATGLYESVGQRLMELIRNSLVASMTSPNVWAPKRAKIEMSIIPNHPLCPSKSQALIVLDHGCGLTDPALERYFNWLGTPLSQLRQHNNGSYGGASQKGIGRLAALALNENCLHDDVMTRIKHGYYLLTRTSKSGNVRFVPVIPEKAETEQGFDTERFISPTSTEMGPLKNLQGSFTAVVIPTPVFKSHAEIYEAIKWLLPREQDKMFDLQIGGKAFGPPPLEKEINLSSQDGRYRARLGVGNTDSDGVWLCDDESGFRVASCQKLGRLLPDPLWYPDLVGDIFAPSLLRHQNTARSTLAKEFTRKGSKEWQRLLMFLIRDVAPQAKQLIERDSIRGNAAETLDELAELFNERFGPPDEDSSGDGPPKKRDHKPPEPGGNGGGGEGGEGGEKETDPERRYRRHIAIRVRDEVFYLYRGQTLHPYVFAQVSPNNPKMIFVNVRGGYKALPEQKAARREHCFVQVLMAIGTSKFPSDRYQAMLFANEVRGEFLKQ